MMFTAGLVLFCLATVALVSAEEKPSPVSMEAICGEWGHDLFAKRNQLELDLAQARAHLKELQKRLGSMAPPVPAPSPRP